MESDTRTNYDSIKNKSEAFLDMKKLIVELISKNPELTQNAIRDRNILIKSLKADIQHRKTTYKEIESRYYKACSNIIELKRTIDSLVLDCANKESRIINLNGLKVQLDALKNETISKDATNTMLVQKIKDLELDLEEQHSRLERSKIHLAVERKTNERTLTYKLEKLSTHIPGWPGKILCSILSSSWILYALLFMIFAILFIASISGWESIAKAFSPIYSIFLKG